MGHLAASQSKAQMAKFSRRVTKSAVGFIIARVCFFPLDPAKLDSDHRLLNTLQKAFSTAGLFCTFNLSPEGGGRKSLISKHQQATSCYHRVLQESDPKLLSLELLVPEAPFRGIEYVL